VKKNDPNILKIVVGGIVKDPPQGIVMNTVGHKIKNPSIIPELLEEYKNPPPAIVEIFNKAPSLVRSEIIVEKYKTQMTVRESQLLDKVLIGQIEENKLRTEFILISYVTKIPFDKTASFADANTAADLSLTYYSTMLEHPKLNNFQKIQYPEQLNVMKDQKNVLNVFGNRIEGYLKKDNPHFQSMFKDLSDIIKLHKKAFKIHPHLTEIEVLSEKYKEPESTIKKYYSNNEHLPKIKKIESKKKPNIDDD